MVECKQAQKASAYLDGELGGPMLDDFERHVRQCPTCAAELSRLRNLSQLFRTIEKPEISAEAVQRLHQSIDLQPKTAILHVAEFCAAVAAAVLIFSISWLLAIPSDRAEAGQIRVWESVAAAPQDSSAMESQEQLAQWLVQDLSWNTSNDQN